MRSATILAVERQTRLLPFSQMIVSVGQSRQLIAAEFFRVLFWSAGWAEMGDAPRATPSIGESYFRCCDLGSMKVNVAVSGKNPLCVGKLSE